MADDDDHKRWMIMKDRSLLTIQKGD